MVIVFRLEGRPERYLKVDHACHFKLVHDIQQVTHFIRRTDAEVWLHFVSYYIGGPYLSLRDEPKNQVSDVDECKGKNDEI